MPKPTFFNLPEEKRQNLIDIAIEEFAANNYNNASISRIVAQAGIAKGSLYQYFEDKKDLYLYLLDLATEEKRAFFDDQPALDPTAGLFTIMRWMVEIGTRFQFSNPRLVKVAYRALYSDVPFPEEVAARMQSASDDYMRQMIEMGVRSGSLDPQVNPQMATFVFSTVMSGLGDYLFRQGLIDSDALEERGLVELVDVTADLLDDLFYILEYGMAAKPEQGIPPDSVRDMTGKT